MATLSSDLIWEVVKQQGSSSLVKRGGSSFSRDPLNLKNSFQRKVRFCTLEHLTID
jgi:large subunit ribosomal protein L28e